MFDPVNITHPIMPCGDFAAIRKYDVHTGVDLYCNEGAEVRSILDGVVVDVFQFTGKGVGSPWWNETHAVVVESEDFTYVYGEIIPSVKIGARIISGTLLGNVTPVLKVDKGVTPTSMLHLELWKTEGYIKNYTWKLGENRPEGLLNPIPHFVYKTAHGYTLKNQFGTIIKFCVMACDMKAWCMSEGIIPAYLK